MSDTFVHTIATMGTVVTFQVAGHGTNHAQRLEREAAVQRAVAWFHEIHDTCTRFDPDSELSRLAATPGVPVRVSPLLFQAVHFALAVAAASAGAFDPTIGDRMEARGFDRDDRTGHTVRIGAAVLSGVSFRDVHTDPDAQTITLTRALVLDLGAVAKGLAIDLAARELQPLENFAIDAGGDLFLGGVNGDGLPWSVGIRHPRDPQQVIARLTVTNNAVCTSGDYERVAPTGTHEHHLMDPRTGASAGSLASVTVLAPSAMVADALSTAAFVLGPVDGLRFLQEQGVEGLLMTPALECIATPGMPRD